MLLRLRITILMCLAVITLGLVACETMGGAGRDIESAGQGIQKSAEQ
jgi:predicted small secreted protein